MRSLRTMGLGLTVALAGALACGRPPEQAEPQPPGQAAIDDPAKLDDFHLDLPYVDAAQWVERYFPTQCAKGYNLVLYQRRVPVLMDMNGRIAHSWPLVRAIGRARLSRSGSLTVIGWDNLVKEYDWHGRLTWHYRLAEGSLPHHDFVQLTNGNYLILAQDTRQSRDYLQEVARDGTVVWEWEPAEHLDRHFPDRDRSLADPTHINSVHELPPNRWFDSGDQRFRPGNILVSARHLNAVFIIDKASGDIVWTYSNGLDFQHEAVMVAEGGVGAGLVVVFNNNYHSPTANRQSAILAIDPVAGRVVWQYRKWGFFSSVAGSEQPLPNGNLLITSSEGGRAFEVNLQGKTVWQWLPPFVPMRLLRYPVDHCPQLARLETEPARAVLPRRRRPFVDLEVYAFTLPEEHTVHKLYGKQRNLLRQDNVCKRLWLPPAASVWFNYGFDRRLLQDERLTARFRAVLRVDGGEESRVLFDDPMDSRTDSVWRTRSASLADLAQRRVELCVLTQYGSELPRDRAEQIVVWESPKIWSSDGRVYRPRPERRLTAEDEKQIEEQLRAIGYLQ